MNNQPYQNLSSLTKLELITLLSQHGIAEPPPEKISFPATILPYVDKYSRRQTEHSIIILLDGANTVIKTVCISSGTLNRTVVHPRDVYREAVKKNAAAIIFVHNHPSGNLEPSNEDIQLTSRLKDAGEIIGIPLLDSIIISKRGYYSLLENNQL